MTDEPRSEVDVKEKTEESKPVEEEEKKEIDAAADPEPAELDAYMDEASADGEGPDEDDRREYLKKRYDQVKAEYKNLLLQKEEADARKNSELQNQITTAFRENYKSRRWTVIELRRMGEKVKDRHVPKSAS